MRRQKRQRGSQEGGASLSPRSVLTFGCPRTTSCKESSRKAMQDTRPFVFLQPRASGRALEGAEGFRTIYIVDVSHLVLHKWWRLQRITQAG